MARPIGPSIEIAASLEAVARLERELATGNVKVQKGALRALKRSLRSGKSAASTEIRAVINLKKKPVDQRIQTKVISTRALIGKVAVRDRRIPLSEFMTAAQLASAYRRARARRRRSKGVSVKVYKQKGAQLYPDTFVELGTRSRKWHVLKRAGREQYPIYIQYGPNLISDFEKGLGRFAARMNDVLAKNIDSELDFALGLR